MKDFFVEILMMFGLKERPSFYYTEGQLFTEEDAEKATYAIKHYGNIYVNGELKMGLGIPTQISLIKNKDAPEENK